MKLLYIGNDIQELETIGFKEDEMYLYPKFMVKGNIYVKAEKTHQRGHKCKFGLLETHREEGHRTFTNNEIDDGIAQGLLASNLFRKVTDEEMRSYEYQY